MKSARRRSREYALQGVYQWLIAGGRAADILAQLGQDQHFPKADADFVNGLITGAIAEAGALDTLIAPALDRKLAEVSPIERAIILLGAYELKHLLEIPYRVVINEAIELAKSFGGTDGHKYVNGVLDRIAPLLRPAELRPG
jgi:transcription antitermination protein NusB